MSVELFSLETLKEIAHQYGYWAVFLGITLENAGIPLPGETITLVGGFLAGSGELNYWFVLLSAIAGAVLGDNFGYWIGKTGGWPLLVSLSRLFRISEDKLLSVKDRFSENAAQAVFLGRFVALLRIFAGPLAGISQMPYQQFFLCNMAGASVWATVMVSLSFFIGELIPLDQLVTSVAKFAVFALVVVLAWFVIPPLLEARSAAEELDP
ncbi:DedA family protein [Oxynema sp. CENA135]|uniref:DedA family protein n=1 Tax=Oxynema sp. CENA135 TaxID=984206 RepID=UPI00190AC270|nr:DedA family protein [Oxynema sp. CENA135]MBK4731563.1 DedA family protein [Oxynema sp. CENA135]